MTGFVASLIKVLIASLICGLLLAQIGLTADKILEEIGGDMQTIDQAVGAALRYIMPPLVTGALIIVPFWLALSLFAPPKK